MNSSSSLYDAPNDTPQRVSLAKEGRQFDKLSNYLPLWSQIIFSLAVALVVVATLSGELMRRQLQADFSATLHNSSEETFGLLTAVALEPIISEDIPLLRTIVNETGRLRPDIRAVRIFNEEEHLLTSWAIKNTNETENLFSFSKDIIFEGELFGTLAIDWSTERLEREAEQQVIRLRYWVAASMLVLTLVIIILMHIFTVRPIGKIHRHLLALTEGKHESRVDIHSSRELSILGSSVNELANALKIKKYREQQLETAQQELFEAKEIAEITLHSIGDGVISTDVNGHIRYLNPISERLTGWSNAEAQGLPVEAVFNLIDEFSRESIANTVRTSLHTGKIEGPSNNAILVSKTGEESAIDDSGSPIRNRKGEIVGAVMVYSDVTETRHMNRELKYQAAHDSLTNLINRSEFSRQLFEARQGVDLNSREHTLLYIDLDRFKIVNDTCGHASGDELLRQLTGLIAEKLRRGDIFARLGGDEFGVLLNECPLEFSVPIADSIRKIVEQFKFVWDGKSFSIGASIGVVTINAQSAQAEELLIQADEACYSAKDQGRNRLQIYTEDDDSLKVRRSELSQVSAVDIALAENRFVLYQQTILPLQVDQPKLDTHFEILVRMIDDDGELVPPGSFIPAIERYGLMSKVDRWVVTHTFDWLIQHPERMAAIELCSINLSANSLSDEDFMHHIGDMLDSPEIDARKICFEITETTAVSNLSLALNFIRFIKNKGCLFALDDFGSGMSSFGYLKNLPVDFLKIDGMFVRDMLHDNISLAMVKSINEVGHVIGKATIAEFAENEEILNLLKHIGIDYAQGYAISKPEPLIRD